MARCRLTAFGYPFLEEADIDKGAGGGFSGNVVPAHIHGGVEWTLHPSECSEECMLDGDDVRLAAVDGRLINLVQLSNELGSLCRHHVEARFLMGWGESIGFLRGQEVSSEQCRQAEEYSMYTEKWI